MPTGITGLARPRQWDALVAVEVPELEGEAFDELGFVAFDDEVVGSAEGWHEVFERVATLLDVELARPYETLLIRRGPRTWTAGARRLDAELVHFSGLDADTVEVALAPDGALSAMLDGQPVEGPVDPAVDAALRELESRGRARFEAFAARADNLGSGRWQLTFDPL